MKVSGVILAAGKGTRMRSDLPKVLHSVLGQPMINYGQTAIKHLDDKYVVVGHKSELVINQLEPEFKSVLQEEQLGTGHAVVTLINSEEFKNDNSDYVLIIPGDVPLLNKDNIDLLIEQVQEKSAALGIITAEVSDPVGYGRIIRSGDDIAKIVEQTDTSEEEQKIREVNSGMYCFNKKFLIENIENLDNDNNQNEIYLTDLIEIAFQNKLETVIVKVSEDTIKGVNSMSQLNDVEKTLREKLINLHMENGVYFQDTSTAFIDENVIIKAGVRIMANTHLTGTTEIHENCTVGPNTMINDSTIGSDSSIISSVLDGVTVKGHAVIGPYAHLRKGSVLEQDVKVGAFAETKNSNIGEGSKIPHLAYVGDADLEENVNFSAGSITVNYDGKNKHRTDIKKDAFIGSDVMLVAPVTIGEGAMIGAGSVITKDVPSKALGIERNQQKNVEGYMDRKKPKEKN
jgi:bifunctional UDP-N-acetylglucosamine pyrophosphorylase/glucosamine-1-phosphate N-acetyltransferase